jgi:hypothetical protein
LPIISRASDQRPEYSHAPRRGLFPVSHSKRPEVLIIRYQDHSYNLFDVHTALP